MSSIWPISSEDVHAVRAEIKSKVLTSLEIQIPLHEAAGARLISSDNLDAWSAYHLGLQHIYRFNRTDNAVAADTARVTAWAADVRERRPLLSSVDFFRQME